MRIAILGTRGIPARYGGFETFAEELSWRLVKLGHAVTVYNRTRFGTRHPLVEYYRGVKIRYAPTMMHKYLETPVHALTSALRLLLDPVDVVLLCNAANSPFAFLIRANGTALAINVDGIERERKKWSSLGKLWYRIGEMASVLFANQIVADAQSISDYYQQRYHVKSELITYGAKVVKRAAGETLAKFGLGAGLYLLYVSRLEPENNALGLVQAYAQVKTDLPLVVVGDAPYATEYISTVKQSADKRVIFTGYQFGRAYEELQSHAAIYIQSSEVGGTHPALVEAMGYGNCIVANDVPEHREVLGEAGVYYHKNDFANLAQQLQLLLGDAPARCALSKAAEARASACYNWDKITQQYQALFSRLLERASGAVVPKC